MPPPLAPTRPHSTPPPPLNTAPRYCDAITSPTTGVDPSSYYASQICGKYIGKIALKQDDATDMTRLLKTSVKYHKRAADIARGSVMLRQPLLSEAERLTRIFFRPGVRPTLNHVNRVLKLCERVHTLGVALQPGDSPFDREMVNISSWLSMHYCVIAVTPPAPAPPPPARASVAA
jgi:hypothetical protein